MPSRPVRHQTSTATVPHPSAGMRWGLRTATWQTTSLAQSPIIFPTDTNQSREQNVFKSSSSKYTSFCVVQRYTLRSKPWQHPVPRKTIVAKCWGRFFSDSWYAPFVPRYSITSLNELLRWKCRQVSFQILLQCLGSWFVVLCLAVWWLCVNRGAVKDNLKCALFACITYSGRTLGEQPLLSNLRNRSQGLLSSLPVWPIHSRTPPRKRSKSGCQIC